MAPKSRTVSGRGDSDESKLPPRSAAGQSGRNLFTGSTLMPEHTFSSKAEPAV